MLNEVVVGASSIHSVKSRYNIARLAGFSTCGINIVERQRAEQAFNKTTFRSRGALSTHDFIYMAFYCSKYLCIIKMWVKSTQQVEYFVESLTITPGVVWLYHHPSTDCYTHAQAGENTPHNYLT